MTAVVQVFIFYTKWEGTIFFMEFKTGFPSREERGRETECSQQVPPLKFYAKREGGGNSRVVYLQFKVGEMNIHSRVCLYSIFTAGYLRVREASGRQSHLL
jgi:hypothetical protein